MFIESLDDLTYDVAGEDGAESRRQEDKAVFVSRGWATVAFLYRERGRDGAFGPPKAHLVRFQRSGDGWRKRASFTVGAGQGRALAALFEKWFAATVASDDET